MAFTGGHRGHRVQHVFNHSLTVTNWRPGVFDWTSDILSFHTVICKQFQWKPNRTVRIFNLQNQNAAVNVSNVLILKQRRSKRLHRRKCKPWSMWNNWWARRSVCRNMWSRAVGSWRSICNTHSCKICRPCSYNILLPLLASSVWGVIVLGRLR